MTARWGSQPRRRLSSSEQGQALALISVISTPSALPESAPESRSALAGIRPGVSTTIAPPQRPVLGSPRGHSERLGAARHASRGAPVEPRAFPWGVGPSLAGAAVGGGATGLAAPAAALLVIAAACLLATRSRGRLSMDPLPWKSALLSLRLSDRANPSCLVSTTFAL